MPATTSRRNPAGTQTMNLCFWKKIISSAEHLFMQLRQRFSNRTSFVYNGAAAEKNGGSFQTNNPDGATQTVFPSCERYLTVIRISLGRFLFLLSDDPIQINYRTDTGIGTTNKMHYFRRNSCAHCFFRILPRRRGTYRLSIDRHRLEKKTSTNKARCTCRCHQGRHLGFMDNMGFSHRNRHCRPVSRQQFLSDPSSDFHRIVLVLQ